MNFALLPRWATPVPGESRASWLAATGRVQPIPQRDWADWVRAAPDEPERPFVSGAPWIGLPPELGDLRTIAPAWRLTPQQRQVFCAQCHVDSDGVRRWAVRVPWLDARRLSCDVHGTWLRYREPADTASNFVLDSELVGLLSWLECWMAEAADMPESLWRRDLVSLVMRNWGAQAGYGPAVAMEWELLTRIAGVQRWQRQEPPGRPSRIGHLAPLARMAVLLAAYRCWRVLEGDMDTRLVPVPAAGWTWFVRRWRSRCLPERARAVGILWQGCQAAAPFRM